MYSGLIIKESIIEENIFDKLNVINVQLWKSNHQPKFWTVVAFTSADEDFPSHLSHAMAAASESGMVWYVDLTGDSVKYIVLKDVVLRCHIGDEKKRTPYVKKASSWASQKSSWTGWNNEIGCKNRPDNFRPGGMSYIWIFRSGHLPQAPLHPE